MNDEPDEQPLFNSLDAMILHERRLNEGRITGKSVTVRVLED